jgi:hypothetical protein
MLTFIKTSTEVTITNIGNIPMDQAQLMAGQMALVLLVQLGEESAELVISAISFERNAMDRHLVLTVLASFRHWSLILKRANDD